MRPGLQAARHAAIQLLPKVLRPASNLYTRINDDLPRPKGWYGIHSDVGGERRTESTV